MRAASLGSSCVVPRHVKESVPADSEACCSFASAASCPYMQCHASVEQNPTSEACGGLLGS